jgi:hypothetical protein
MNFNLTWNTSAAESNLTRLRAGDFSWPHSEIAALEKCAGEAGNRHGSDLGMRLTNLKPRTTMNLNPAELLNPIFNALDDLIENDGVYCYLVFVWLSLALIACVLSGGLRRERPQGDSATIISGIIIAPRPPMHQPRHSSSPMLTRRGMATTK